MVVIEAATMGNPPCSTYLIYFMPIQFRRVEKAVAAASWCEELLMTYTIGYYHLYQYRVRAEFGSGFELELIMLN